MDLDAARLKAAGIEAAFAAGDADAALVAAGDAPLHGVASRAEAASSPRGVEEGHADGAGCVMRCRGRSSARAAGVAHPTHVVEAGGAPDAGRHGEEVVRAAEE